MKSINKAWLTLNRVCNLRCKWCYAAGSGYDEKSNMAVDLALRILAICKELNVKQIDLIGGEPTLYPHLSEIIRFSNSLGICTRLITNGIVLKNKTFLDSLVFSGLSSIDISLKGFSERNYVESTGKNLYSDVLSAIRLVTAEKISCSVSFVLSTNNIDDYLYAIKDAVDSGAESFNFSFCCDCSPLFNELTNGDYDVKTEILEVVDKFQKSYDELNLITKGNFVLHQTFPLCVWNKKFIEDLIHKQQVIFSCQLADHDSIIFDTDGTILPCNLMSQMKIGKIDNDYVDATSLIELWNNPRTVDFLNQLAFEIPDKECLDNCENWNLCLGGCPINWMNFSYPELKEAISSMVFTPPFTTSHK